MIFCKPGFTQGYKQNYIKFFSKVLLLSSVVMLLQTVLFSTVTLADSNYEVEITHVAITGWPEITVYFHLKDKQTGQRVIKPLNVQDVSLNEEGRDVKVKRLTQPGQSQSSVSTALILDVSGSMNDSGKLAAAKDAGIQFVNMMRDQDQTALITFNDSVRVVQPFTSDKTLLTRQLQNLSAGGGTIMYDAVYNALDLLGGQGGRKLAIVLTDGMSSNYRHTANDVIDYANKQQLQIYTVGVGGFMSLDEDGLKKLASSTGGEYHQVSNVSEMSKLYQGFAQSLLDEYSVSYDTPRPVNDGTTRPVKLSVLGATDTGSVKEPNFIHLQSSLALFIPVLIALLVLLFLPLFLQLKNRKAAASYEGLQPNPDIFARPDYPQANVVYPPANNFNMNAEQYAPPPGVSVATQAVPLVSKTGSQALVVIYPLQLPLSIGTSQQMSIRLSPKLTGGMINLEMTKEAGTFVINDLGSQAHIELNFKGLAGGVFRPLSKKASIKESSILKIGPLSLEILNAGILKLSLNLDRLETLSFGGRNSDLALAAAGNEEIIIQRLDPASLQVRTVNSAAAIQSIYQPGRPIVKTNQVRFIEGSEIIMQNGVKLHLERN